MFQVVVDGAPDELKDEAAGKTTPSYRPYNVIGSLADTFRADG